ncbi:peptide ABC transporter substrate-binding protein [Cellvibrio zantedeschiae]|uniref:Peptide ABC transporter substrate-binding protein n=1 Tax=Cellvibrio zantedeschiae TaxID=1237077 RepID=A0ABQ3AQA6_9GAMM|nr:FecR family protein [Cellvibrio zantedeschiae]GGY62460.1 peptide ABC transporter substrate-binding protein [Cellvibrio zantedeschiae]
MQADQLERINNEAREWFTLMQSGSVSELEQQHFQEWLQADSAHQHAYDQYEMIWQDLGNLKNTKELAALKRSVKPSLFETIRNGIFSGLHALKPKSPLGVALASAAILVVAVIGLQPEKITTQEFATATGEVKTFILEDGSEITLGAKSELKAWATNKERHIILVSGQAFFKVAKNPERPFWVDAGETKVRVVGTQFDVRKGSDRTRVAVLEGIVNVSSATKSANLAPVVLTAGQQVTRLNEGKFEAVNSISVSELESWRNGRLIYLRASLADVVADANRYFSSSISLGSKNLADLKVTAAVSTNQIDSLTEMLASSLPVVLERDAQNNIVIVSRSDVDNIPHNTK